VTESPVAVEFACAREDLPAAEELRGWARAALAAAGAPAALDIRVVDEPEGTELNRRYRHREGATNVLSFPFEAPPGAASDLLGDLAICAPVVRREATEQGKSVVAHLAHMVVHGTLHLLGFDHQQEREAQEMEQREREILATLGFPDPYAGESR